MTSAGMMPACRMNMLMNKSWLWRTPYGLGATTLVRRPSDPGSPVWYSGSPPEKYLLLACSTLSSQPLR